MPKEAEYRLQEVWSEGYVATGGSGPAHLHGTGWGSTFKEACDYLADNNRPFDTYYDSERGTYWGCKLFDNQTDASKSFG